MGAGDDEIDERAAYWFMRMRASDAASARAEFDAWRHADPRHAVAYQRLAENWRRSDVIRHSDLLDGFRLRPPWWKRLHLDRPRVFAPAIAVIVLALALTVWAVAARAPGSPPTTAQSSRLGEVRTVTLSDGSTITLDTDSRVSESFTRTERTVRLERGRARFDVVHDAARPFIVWAGAVRITDKGTVFDVRMQAGEVDVVLLRGSAEVRSFAPAIASASSASLILIAGQRASIPADRPPERSSIAPSTPPTWISGMLDFDDAPLGDVVAEINRYNTRRIVIADPDLASLRVTGSYRASAPDDAARNLAALFDLRVGTDPRGNWILRSDGVRADRHR